MARRSVTDRCLTKLMEATVILQLVGEGKIGPDDRLSDVPPEHDWVERADGITVRQGQRLLPRVGRGRHAVGAAMDEAAQAVLCPGQ